MHALPHTTTLPRALRTRPLAAALALAFCGAAGGPAQAGFVSWIDWQAKAPGSVIGTLYQGTEAVLVTFTGDYSAAFTDGLPEPYWGPQSTYKSPKVPNAPPSSDIIFIPGGPDELKLSFSQPLISPIFAIASLGLKTSDGSFSKTASMEFDRPLGVLSNGPNYYAGGLFSQFAVNGNTLSGAESSGTVLLDGGGTEIIWKSPLRENVGGVLVGTYGFTIGVDCSDFRVGPAVMTQAGAVPAGCRGYSDRSFMQTANFEVRGRLENRVGAQWVQGDSFTLAAGGRLSNSGIFIVGEGQTFTSRGELVNGTSEGGNGWIDVRGTLKIDSAGAVNFGNLTLKGDNTFSTSGRLLVQPGARLYSTGTVEFEAASQAQVGGLLDNSGGQVFIDAANARLEVKPTGTLATSGRITVGRGQLLNQGLTRVDSGGVLFVKRPGLTDPPGTQLDNQGQLTVLAGGLLHVDGETNPTAVVGLAASMHNRAGATTQLDGRLELSGGFDNAGQVNIAAAGAMKVNGGFASFNQLASGQLQVLGRIDVVNRGRMVLSGITYVPGALQIEEASRVTVLPDGKLTLAPLGSAVASGLGNNGILVNQGTTSLVAGGVGASADHQNNGLIQNTGLFRIGNGGFLTEAGLIQNSGRFQIDAGGTLYVTEQSAGFTQTALGVLVNNGNVAHTSPLFTVIGGRISGSGTFTVGSAAFEGLELEPGEEELSIGRSAQRLVQSAALPPGSFATGTMRFTGDLLLGAGATARLKFSENGGNDKLILGGSLVSAGGRVELVFPVNSAPGLDQVFSFHESPTGWVGGFSLTAPADYELTELNLTPGADGLQRRAAVFTPRGAAELTAVGLAVGIDVGQQRYIQTPIEGAGIDFWNAGVLGIRNLPDSSLRVRSFINDPRASLLNSAFFTVNERFTNQGVVKNRAGAEFINLGRLENQAGATLDNRGLLVNGAAGRIINRGQLVLHGELRDESLLGAAGQQTVLNDGGRVDIQASGRLVGSGRFEQSGAGASTRVDGLLQAASIFISEGSLGGSGRIQGALSLGQDAQLAPGNSPGTLTVEGSLTAYGGEFIIELAGAQSFDRLVVDGDVLLSSTVRFRLVDGYTPLAGDSWTWLAVSGEVFYLPLYWGLEVPDGTGWALLADANGTYDTQGLLPERALFSFDGYTLSLSQAPVPEPGTWALWLAGLAAVTRIARKRGVPQPGRAD